MNNSNMNLPQPDKYVNRGLSVDGVIIREKKILLIKRGREPFKGYWALPGGYIEWDESTEEAVAREVMEETGLTVNSCELIGVYSLPNRHPKQVINIAYSLVTTGEPKAGDDVTEIKWCPL